jgi:hypothetical protein
VKPLKHFLMFASWAALALHQPVQAAAWTELNLTGASTLHQRLDETGFSFEAQLIPFTVRAGEPQTFHWDYHLTVADSGQATLPSGPELGRYSMCNFINPTTCPPAPSGYESARAQVLIGHVDGRATPPFLNISGSNIDMATARGPESDFMSRSGSANVSVSIDPSWTSIMEYTGAFGVFSSQWVIANPVPEPETMALMLAGLGAVFLRRKTSDARLRGPGNKAGSRRIRLRLALKRH